VSTFISLVIVGGCIGAVTWMVLREDGQPATDAAVRRRAAHDERRQRRAERRMQRADDRAARATAAAAAQLQAQADARAAAEAQAEADARADAAAQTAVTPAPASPAPAPDAAPAPAGRRARGAVRAPDTVQGRRRDVGGHQVHGSQPVLVRPEDVPAAEPARSSVVHRLRSGAGLLVLLVVLGAGVALAIGLVAVTIADALQRSVS
jgi:hypothetical protein